MTTTPASYSRPALQQIALLVSVLLTGLSAGFFATYEYSVTRALAAVDDRVYVVAFQAINASVRSAEFGTIFFGSLISLVVAIFLSRSNRSTLLALTAALVAYGIMLVITFTVHIPLNESLAIVDANTQATAGRNVFEGRWNDMHLVRTIAVLGAFILTTLGLTFSKRK